ncbi:uncharacterized protein LOC117175235 [Belonocnema kinseyi]|uniref:uncharacterized protein LOC117175235 n=1 Tax=Belonocnema kinseyi TaxID=2817044 RepID=UPI00143DFD64|nr:uncharacterized protein LOC117175235 [Belonocnema kinseyi]
MKSVVFCLLTFYVIENVFSDKLMDQLNEVYNNGLKSLRFTIPNQILAEVSNDVDKTSGDDRKKAQNCYDYAKSSMKTFSETMFEPITKELGKCRDQGLQSQSVEVAKTCSNKVMDVFSKVVEEVKSSAKSCISSIKE